MTKKKDNGITLIALVITIIIMLILVAVTVSVAFGENGLITRAMKAGKSWKDEEFREQVEMDLAAVIADLSAEGKTANTITDDLIKKLEDMGYDVTDNEDGTITVGKDDKTANIDEELNVTIGGEAVGNKAKPTIGFTLIEDATVITTGISSNIGSVNDNVPIPTGFTFMEGTREDGLVVRDSDLNEFVWVPVKMYEGIQVNITHKNSAEKVRKYAEGEQTVEYFASNGTTFTGNKITIPKNERAKTTTYTIYAESKNGEKATKQVTIDGMYWENGTQKVGQLYSFYDNGSGEVGVGKYPAYNDTTWREPDVVVGENGTEYDAVATNRVNAGFTGTVEGFEAQLQTDFDGMVRSVQEYKGFYIGRYTTAGLNGTVVVKSGQGSTGTNIDPSINQDWYVSYKKQREFKPTTGSVISDMIWGCQWDQVMLWMKDVKNTNSGRTYDYYVIDPTNMGNYTGDGRIVSGSNADYKVKNIYDMAGNMMEWTQGASGLDYRVSLRCRVWV